MSESERELDLQDYVAVFRQRWRWLAGTAVVVVGLVTVFTLTRDEVYASNSEVLILTEQNQSVFNTREPELFRTAISELQYMAGERYSDAVEDLAGREVEFTPGLRFVDAAEETESAGVLRVDVEASTPGDAVAGAEAAGEAYLQDRVDQFTQSFERRRDELVADRSELSAERDQLTQQIDAATAAAAAETDPVTKAALEAQRNLLIADLRPQIERLTERVGEVGAVVSYTNGLLKTLAEPESTARLLNPATIPRQPVSPDVPRNVMIGIVVGIVLGLILTVLRDLLDPRARNRAELAQLVDVPVMATIGEIRRQSGAPGRIRRYRDLSEEEASGYQVLLNSLWLSNVDDPLQSVAFTSDRAGVGKTQTVVNLAQAEAARGTRVLIIDADFVNPSVAARLDVVSSDLGLADLLLGSAPVEAVAIATEIENLHIIDAPAASGAGELLRSDLLRGVLADLYSSYDLILIDSPPTLSTSDSRLVASQVDGVVVVYDPAQSRREELERTIDLLRGAKANLVGLVANRSQAGHPVYLAAGGR